MASNTPRLNLYKKDPVADANTTFNITTMLNDNWDRIDQNVALQADLHTHANKAVLDKFSEGADGKPLYNGQKITDETTIQALQKEIANLNLQLEASQRVPNGYTFGSDFSNTFGMTIDYTKTTAIGALAIGTMTIPVQDVTGFAVGQEVTIYDDVNLERVTISAIDATNKTLTVSALTKSYKDKANVARTMAVADTVNKCLKFGSWSTQTTNTVTDATVVASAYNTSGNGGRKLVRLSNGWLVATAYNSSNHIHYFYKSTDNGATWTQLCYFGNIYTTEQSAIVANGTTVYAIISFNNNSLMGVHFVKFDVTTVANGNLPITATVDSIQTSINGISLAINSAGTELHATWASINSTYPNSSNIRYAKGTINTDGSVAWGAVEQVTKLNNSSYQNFAINPCIILSNNTPIIFIEQNGGAFLGTTYNGNNAISILKRDSSLTTGNSYVDSNWSCKNVYSVTGYTQSSPSACVSPNGRIWVAWYGMDETDTTANNIRVAYSDNGGQTWSAMTKLTSGNNYSQAYPSITSNKNNEIFILWSGRDSSDSYNDIRMIKYSGGSWGSVSIISSGTTNNKWCPSTLYDVTLDFSTPLFIYQDQQGNKVGFYGTWKVGSTVPLLENDIRFTVKDTDEVVAWAERDELAGFTVDAQLNGQAMTKTSVSGEDQFTGTLPSVQPAELKLTMTRASTADDVKITKILGGVA